ncbi:MAG: thiamine diphosphokinase [Desulfobacterales bacterium]|nr:MAG: thiamine diphosphokinase [Desulfobacterales bacterium]
MKCIIAGSGQFTPTEAILSQIKSADLILAADGGAVHLQRNDIIPDMIIGDLDSISDEVQQFYADRQVPIKTYPTRKDQTDTALCIDYAATLGCTHITLIGVTGQRLDHTLANILLLRRMVGLGIEARIIDAHNEIYLVLSDLKIMGMPGELLSIIPVSEHVTGLTLEGLEYPLKNADLCMGTTLGISNCFTATCATVHIDSGALIVTKSKD